MQKSTTVRERDEPARLLALQTHDFHTNFLTRLIAFNQKQEKSPAMRRAFCSPKIVIGRRGKVRA